MTLYILVDGLQYYGETALKIKDKGTYRYTEVIGFESVG
jgi:hypothetical protein